jgi:hypothetical protein
MKELSTNLFLPVINITIFVVMIYYIKYGNTCSTNKSESWSSLVDANKILDPKPVVIEKHEPTCNCPRCPQMADSLPPVRDIAVYPESAILIDQPVNYNAMIPTNQSYERDYRVLTDPLYPPEQRSDSDYYYPREIVRSVQTGPGGGHNRVIVGDNPQLYGNGYFRQPTRGYPPPYQMKGYLVDNNNPGNIISLFGRPKYLGSTQWQYYVSKRDLNNNEIKIDIPHNKEVYGGESIKIKKDIFPGDYKFVEYKTEELIQPPLY